MRLCPMHLWRVLLGMVLLYGLGTLMWFGEFTSVVGMDGASSKVWTACSVGLDGGYFGNGQWSATCDVKGACFDPAVHEWVVFAPPPPQAGSMGIQLSDGWTRKQFAPRVADDAEYNSRWARHAVHVDGTAVLLHTSHPQGMYHLLLNSVGALFHMVAKHAPVLMPDKYTADEAQAATTPAGKTVSVVLAQDRFDASWFGAFAQGGGTVIFLPEITQKTCFATLRVGTRLQHLEAQLKDQSASHWDFRRFARLLTAFLTKQSKQQTGQTGQRTGTTTTTTTTTTTEVEVGGVPKEMQVLPLGTGPLLFPQQSPASSSSALLFLVPLRASRRVVNLVPALQAGAAALGGSIAVRLLAQLETLSKAAQGALFAHGGVPAVLVCEHGAACSNMVFMAPGSVVVELFGYGYWNPCFEKLAERLGHAYLRWQPASASHVVFTDPKWLRKLKTDPLWLGMAPAMQEMVEACELPSWELQNNAEQPYYYQFYCQRQDVTMPPGEMEGILLAANALLHDLQQRTTRTNNKMDLLERGREEVQRMRAVHQRHVQARWARWRRIKAHEDLE